MKNDTRQENVCFCFTNTVSCLWDLFESATEHFEIFKSKNIHLKYDN